MPFTPSHVMAVLPGVRWAQALRLDPTCLVVGSMAPDFEYFARGGQVSSFSHTLIGVVVWGIPATLVVAALWHHLVKWPILVVAPRSLTPVFAAPWSQWTAAAITSAVVSALLGNLTHVAWDAFTHANGIFVRWIPALRTAYDVPVLGAMTTHRILQHASTLVGLAAIVAYTIRRARPLHLVVVPRVRAALVFASAIAMGGALTGGRLVVLHHSRDIGSIVAGIMSGMLAGTILASLVMRSAGRRYRELALRSG